MNPFTRFVQEMLRKRAAEIRAADPAATDEAQRILDALQRGQRATMRPMPPLPPTEPRDE